MTHCSSAGAACVAVPMAGSATFVTVTSIKVMKRAAMQTPRARHRGVWGGAAGIAPSLPRTPGGVRLAPPGGRRGELKLRLCSENARAGGQLVRAAVADRTVRKAEAIKAAVATKAAVAAHPIGATSDVP